MGFECCEGGRGASDIDQMTRRVSVTACFGLVVISDLTVSLGAAADELFLDGLVHFVPSQKNRGFAGTGAATWDHKISERGSILQDNGNWHL